MSACVWFVSSSFEARWRSSRSLGRTSENWRVRRHGRHPTSQFHNISFSYPRPAANHRGPFPRHMWGLILFILFFYHWDYFCTVFLYLHRPLRHYVIDLSIRLCVRVRAYIYACMYHISYDTCMYISCTSMHACMPGWCILWPDCHWLVVYVYLHRRLALKFWSEFVLLLL